MISVRATEIPVFSVILVIYQAGKSVIETVDLLVKNTPTPFELVLVDNASPDASGAAVRANVVGAKFIWNRSNLGFGPAINAASHVARSEVLCLLNPDVSLSLGWESHLLKTLKDTECAAVSPLIVSHDGSIEAGRTIDRLGFTHPSDALSTDQLVPYAVTYASAACLFIRTSDFRMVNGFDERFVPAYFEDVDLCLRLAAETGKPVLVDPRSSVAHLGGVSSNGSQREEMFGANLRRFNEKWDLETGVPVQRSRSSV